MPRHVIDRPSPNFGDRQISDGAAQITMLVLHYTGMATCDDALERLCDTRSQVSAHILIDEDGTTYRLVADEKRAWHAGHAFWRGLSDINSASIGIELTNPGHENGYCRFPLAQIEALIEVCLELRAKHKIPDQGIVGHSDIAPGRKEDPGELFPWEQLSGEGIGLWPSSVQPPAVNGTPWDALAEIGYAVPGGAERGSSILDPETAETDVIRAFQRRFLPHSLTGMFDAPTLEQISRVRETYCKSLI